MDGWRAQASERRREGEKGRKERDASRDGREDGGGIVAMGTYVWWNIPKRKEILDVLWAVGVQLCSQVYWAAISDEQVAFFWHITTV